MALCVGVFLLGGGWAGALGGGRLTGFSGCYLSMSALNYQRFSPSTGAAGCRPISSRHCRVQTIGTSGSVMEK